MNRESVHCIQTWFFGEFLSTDSNVHNKFSVLWRCGLQHKKPLPEPFYGPERGLIVNYAVRNLRFGIILFLLFTFNAGRRNIF